MAGEANRQWGGRFKAASDDRLLDLNNSIGFDWKLWRQDIAGSLAHAAMLERTGIVSSAEADAIRTALNGIRAEIEDGRFTFEPALEDIHMNVEARLIALVGDAGRKLHTARSRNDQVATDFRLWIRDAIDRLQPAVGALMRSLALRAAEHADTVMPGFTHLQVAQPITFGHHLLAYVEMLGRDRDRLGDCRERLNECPLGAAALAGTGFPIDRRFTAERLGFARPMRNSVDAVSDRDFALEYLSVLAMLIMHLSRLGEELVSWSSPMFGFVTLPEDFTTGSSIMPQKRNPDAAELIRAKSGRVFGSLVGLLTAMKGLPLAYSKDMQEDKEAVFEASETVSMAVAAMDGMIAGLQAHPSRMAAMAGAGFSTATDLADWLVRELGMPFRNAHHVTGRLVRAAEEAGLELAGLPIERMRQEEPGITETVFGVLTPENSVRSRRSEGGTAPELVAGEARRWLAVLDGEMSGARDGASPDRATGTDPGRAEPA